VTSISRSDIEAAMNAATFCLETAQSISSFMPLAWATARMTPGGIREFHRQAANDFPILADRYHAADRSLTVELLTAISEANAESLGFDTAGNYYDTAHRAALYAGRAVLAAFGEGFADGLGWKAWDVAAEELRLNRTEPWTWTRPQIEKLLTLSGIDYEHVWSAVVLRFQQLPVFELQGTHILKEATRAIAALRSADDGPWSRPDSPTRWATLFGINPRTFKRHIRSGKIRGKRLSDRLYRVHIDDVPKTKK